MFLQRIDRLGPALNCFIRVMPEEALREAAEIDGQLARGVSVGPLAGVPIGIKDIVDVADIPTTHGAHRIFHTIPTRDAPVVRRLRAAGAIVIGKTTLHEFAYGVTNNNPHFGPTRNPWDLARIPGGSSGGSAAAVAAGLCGAAIGTDTGGSIRIPAALCGIVGMKPTYDHVSREGVTPLAWTLDHVGPLTRTVDDADLLLHIMSGAMGYPPTFQPGSSGPGTGRGDGLIGVRIGLPRLYWDQMDDDVRGLLEAAIRTLESMGAAISEVAIPDASTAGDAVALIISVEATAAHESQLRLHPEAYGADVRARLDSGFFVRGTDYVQAQRVRSRLQRVFRGALENVDLLAMPTTALAAPPIEDPTPPGPSGPAPIRLSLTKLTNPFNLLGLPALSVPCGLTALRLPVGLQLVGRATEETTVFRVGRSYERATAWSQWRPPLERAGG